MHRRVAQVVSNSEGHLSIVGAEYQKIAIANTIVVQCLRLIEGGAVESCQGPSLGGRTGFGVATDDVDDRWKHLAELDSVRQGKVGGDRLVLQIGLYRHPTQV